MTWYLVQQPIRGLRAYVVLSGSMKPAIPVGSLVITKSIPVQDYQVGSVVAFPAPSFRNTTILHRIHALSRNGVGVVEVITKGDANTVSDSWVLNLAILEGKSVVTIPWLGYVLHILTTPFGFIVTAFLLFCLVVIPEIRFLVSLFIR